MRKYGFLILSSAKPAVTSFNANSLVPPNRMLVRNYLHHFQEKNFLSRQMLTISKSSLQNVAGLNELYILRIYFYHYRPFLRKLIKSDLDVILSRAHI